ncbi:MAG: hypothetical protein K2O65_12390 [Lachnospiraceae bacterium]|nr:hypothetical protein [Lachnospiraceae bacterium]
MVPEFCIPESVEEEGLYEEQLCWENVWLQLDFFHSKGYINIVALDFDDVRASKLPKKFAGYRYIILRLVSSDAEQIIRQMIHRYHNEAGCMVRKMLKERIGCVELGEMIRRSVIVPWV